MRSMEETMNDVAFSNGYINWEDFLEAHLIAREKRIEFSRLVGEVAKEYSRDAEAYYNEEVHCDCYQEDEYVRCPECEHEFEIQEGR